MLFSRAPWVSPGGAVLLAIAVAGCGLHVDLGRRDAAPAVGLHLGGADGRIEVPDSPYLAVGAALTIEMWVNLDQGSTMGMLTDKWQGGAEDRAIMINNPVNMELTLYLPGNAWAKADSTEIPPAGVWTHVAATYGDGAARLFLNGQRVGTTPSTAPVVNGAGTLFIGATQRETLVPPAAGYFRAVRFSSVVRYTDAFTPDRDPVVDSDTVAFWPLDDGAGTQAADLGPHGLTGALAGEAEWRTAPSP